MSTRRVQLVLVSLALASCPSTSIPNGFCGEDSDCGTGQTCLFDVNLSTSYCAAHCVDDKECAPNQFCSIGHDTAISGGTELKVCVDRVRECGGPEVCNGLDDNCDDVIDGSDCQVIVGCLDDLP